MDLPFVLLSYVTTVLSPSTRSTFTTRSQPVPSFPKAIPFHNLFHNLFLRFTTGSQPVPLVYNALLRFTTDSQRESRPSRGATFDVDSRALHAAHVDDVEGRWRCGATMETHEDARGCDEKRCPRNETVKEGTKTMERPSTATPMHETPTKDGRGRRAVRMSCPRCDVMLDVCDACGYCVAAEDETNAGKPSTCRRCGWKNQVGDKRRMQLKLRPHGVLRPEQVVKIQIDACGVQAYHSHLKSRIGRMLWTNGAMRNSVDRSPTKPGRRTADHDRKEEDERNVPDANVEEHAELMIPSTPPDIASDIVGTPQHSEQEQELCRLNWQLVLLSDEWRDSTGTQSERIGEDSRDWDTTKTDIDILNYLHESLQEHECHAREDTDVTETLSLVEEFLAQKERLLALTKLLGKRRRIVAQAEQDAGLAVMHGSASVGRNESLRSTGTVCRLFSERQAHVQGILERTLHRFRSLLPQILAIAENLVKEIMMSEPCTTSWSREGSEDEMALTNPVLSETDDYMHKSPTAATKCKVELLQHAYHRWMDVYHDVSDFFALRSIGMCK